MNEGPGSGGYFSQEGSGTPAAEAFVADLDASSPYQLAEGILVRAVAGHRCMVNLVEMNRGSEAPLHSHDEEQIVVVLDGSVVFEIEGEERIVSKGEAIVIPSWVLHRAVGHAEVSHTVEVFSPPRAALLDLMGDTANTPSTLAPERR